MQHHCAEYTQSVSQTANALEAVLAARIINRRPLYVEERTDYGAVFLYGADYSDRRSSNRAVQLDLHSDCSPRGSLHLYLWHLFDGFSNEHGPVVFAQKFNLEFWLILRLVLRIDFALANADCLADFLEDNLGDANDGS